jgi:hypothetical protein
LTSLTSGNIKVIEIDLVASQSRAVSAETYWLASIDRQSDASQHANHQQAPVPEDPPRLHQLVNQRLRITMDVLGQDAND